MKTSDWLRAWLSREIGKGFALTQQDEAIQLQRELEKGLRSPAWWEGIGGCSCGGRDHVVPVERERACYIGEEFFLRVCPDCDSWALFKTTATKECYGCKKQIPVTWKLPVERERGALGAYLVDNGIVCEVCYQDDACRPRPIPADEAEFKKTGGVPRVRST